MGTLHGPMASILPSPRLFKIKKASNEAFSALLTSLTFANAFIRLRCALLSEAHRIIRGKDQELAAFSSVLGTDKKVRHPIKAGKIANVIKMQSKTLHLFKKGIINRMDVIFYSGIRSSLFLIASCPGSSFNAFSHIS